MAQSKTAIVMKLSVKARTAEVKLTVPGEGGYAAVVRVRERSSGRVCVVKKIHNAFATAADAQRVVREVAYQRAADHPNIVPLLGAYAAAVHSQ